jgi:hypothetical protein
MPAMPVVLRLADCRQYQAPSPKCILFSVVFTPSPPSYQGNVYVLPVISLPLSSTVSPVQACITI